jgi:hypothetical protein
LWAATPAGRVFISKNADADPASAVTFTRIDIATSPNRYISDIAVDPANENHAWIVYNGFNPTVGSIPGHVFEFTFDPAQARLAETKRATNQPGRCRSHAIMARILAKRYLSSPVLSH